MTKISFARLLATWFGCGESPSAPGTVGSAAAIAIAWAIHALWNPPPWSYAVLAAALFPAAVWAAGKAASDAGLEDPGFVVIDEVVGQWIALAGAPVLDWHTFIAAFALFRVFDILKPPPVRQLEALHGGLGIVADDAMAGIYAALVLFVAGCFNFY